MHQCEALRDRLERKNQNGSLTRSLLDYVVDRYGTNVQNAMSRKGSTGKTRLALWAEGIRGDHAALARHTDTEVLIAATCGISSSGSAPISLGRLIPSIVEEIESIERRRSRAQIDIAETSVVMWTNITVRTHEGRSYAGFRCSVVERDQHATILWMSDSAWNRYMRFKESKGQNARADIYRSVDRPAAQQGEISGGTVVRSEPARRWLRKGRRIVLCHELP